MANVPEKMPVWVWLLMAAGVAGHGLGMGLAWFHVGDGWRIGMHVVGAGIMLAAAWMMALRGKGWQVWGALWGMGVVLAMWGAMMVMGDRIPTWVAMGMMGLGWLGMGLEVRQMGEGFGGGLREMIWVMPVIMGVGGSVEKAWVTMAEGWGFYLGYPVGFGVMGAVVWMVKALGWEGVKGWLLSRSRSGGMGEKRGV